MSKIDIRSHTLLRFELPYESAPGNEHWNLLCRKRFAKCGACVLFASSRDQKA